ncbi:MAG: VCBS repeat-containing protein [Algoriphagus sp.]
MSKISFFPYVLVVLCFTACQQKNSLFELKSTEETGIDFNNEIIESDSFNILTDEYIFNGGGVATADFDRDGLPDLFFTGNQVPNRLYLNQGEFTFSDVSEDAGVMASDRWCTGTVVVDINEDGWPDLYVATAMKKGPGERNNLLFVNQGKDAQGALRFKEMASQYGIADPGNSMGAAFLDYDLDGDLDLYVLNNEQLAIKPTNFKEKITDGSAINNDSFYKNNGDGTFTNVTLEAGIIYEGFGLGLAIGDVNNDGWPDIHVSNDYITNDILYINNQNGTFSNKTKEVLRHQSQFSMGSDMADLTNDGLPDLITIDMLGEDSYRKKTTIGKNVYQTYINNEQFGYEYQYVRNMLHINNGPGIPFSEVGMLSGVYQTDWSWAPLMADIDNDGRRDLLITNGFPRDITDKDFANYRADVGNIASVRQLLDSIPIVKIPNYAYKQVGELAFEDVGETWGLNQPSFSNGAVLVDLDLDGDLDYVVNNINDPAFVFENKLNQKKEKPNYLRVKLKGNKKNPDGLGAKVWITYNQDQLGYQEMQVVRGYMSSTEPIIHFGVDNSKIVEEVLVMWPDGKVNRVTDVGSNQVIEMDYASASAGTTSVAVKTLEEANQLLTEVSASLGIDYLHQEDDKIDFNVQRTLPHKLSQYGPTLAVGDLNGDQREDVVIGSSAGFAPVWYSQNQDGSFSKKELLPKESIREEITGILLFDLDQDRDLDMYLVSGSAEFVPNAPEYQDRLYLNDGKGNFSLDKRASLPLANGSVVRGADIDGDGWMDLFVGGRSPIGQYPLAERSFLLKNQGGTLVDATSSWLPGLEKIGMITDALFSDVNADGKVDLVVVGELMPITVLLNTGTAFQLAKETGLESYTGWWNSIASADLDQDGDSDWIVGNLGANNAYHPSADRPVKVYVKDFDANGSVDPISFAYYKEKIGGEYQAFPSHFWDDLIGQSPMFRRKFDRYKYFAKSTEQTFFTEEEKKDARVFTGTWDRSVWVENLGGGKFSIHELPIQAQLAPMNGIVADDFNGDGYTDLMMVGNDYGNEVFIGRLDASIGWILLGNGKGELKYMPGRASGFMVPGDAKALVKLSAANGSMLYLASQNRSKLLAFAGKNSNLRNLLPPVEAMAVVLDFADGRKQRVDLGLGAGFASQSSRVISLPAGVSAVKMITYQGKEVPLSLPTTN